MSSAGASLGCIREFCSGSESHNAPKTLARSMVSGEIDLLTIVEALGEYLASGVVGERCRGTQLLSETLVNLSSHQLPEDDVHYLVEFYCDRLKDKATILPYVLCGLHAMVVNQKISDVDVVVISRAIYSQVYNQSLPQGERRMVYTILDYFLSDHTQAVKEMGSEFVLGYIQAMDGEKDPRNLAIALNSVHRIVLYLPFEVLAEDLFEVVACYFPIDFTPPPGDPGAVSKEDLVLQLRKCLTSTPKFTQFCLPLMLEKVSSDLLSAKLESLLAIAAGCPLFDLQLLHTHLQPLWTAIQREIFEPVSQEVEAAGVECLEGLSKALGAGDGRGGEIREFTEMVLKDCSRHFMEPELKLLTPATRALVGVARGCGQASAVITAALVPVLLQQFHSRSPVSQKKALLQVLVEILDTLHSFHETNKPSPLDPHKAELISLVVPCVRGRRESLVEIGLDICRALLLLQDFLDRKEIEMLAGHMKQLALYDSETLSVREKACGVLGCIAELYPYIAKETLLPPLLELFTLDTETQPMETDKDSEAVSMTNISRVLVALSVLPDLQELTLPAFMAVMQQLAEQTPSPEVAAAAEVLTGDLCRVVEKTVTRSVMGLRCVHKMVVGQVLRLCVLPSLSETLDRRVFREEAVLKHCLSLLRTFTLAANNTTDVSESWCGLIREIFLENGSSILPQNSTFSPLKPLSPPAQTRLISILTYTVGAMTREMVSSQASVYLPKLLDQAMLCLDDQSSSHSAVCAATLINKITNCELLEQFVKPAMSRMWQAMVDESTTDVKSRERSFNMWIWLSKALVLRSHPLGRTATLKLLELFGNSVLCSQAAEGFSVILADSDVMNLKNHSITRLMYKQQFCQEVVPELVGRFSSAPSVERQYFLRSLSHILQHVPKQVLLEHLPLLHPLLLESLNASDAALCESTLDGLHTILQNSASAALMSDHIPSIVPRLLTLATRPDSMRVRCSALACLYGLSKLPRHLVVPYQSQVLQALVTCLDDRKRLVRREAVITRSSWFV